MFAKRPQDVSRNPTPLAPRHNEPVIDLEPIGEGNLVAQNTPVDLTTSPRIETPQRNQPGNHQATRSSGAVLPESVISTDLTIYGNVASRGRIRLEGKIEGELNCKAIEVGETGTVEGGIKAEEVEVRGKVSGTITGGNVMLYRSAHVEGDIRHRGIGIEMGTHYDGRLTWDKSPKE